MKGGGIGARCRGVLEDIWSCWPDPSSLSGNSLEHAESCLDCRTGLEEMRALCRFCAFGDGRPLSWAHILPTRRWNSLAASIRKALKAWARKI